MTTETGAHPFDLATVLKQDGEGRYVGHTTPDYSNMVGPFGGITAATLLRAVLDDPRRIADPLSITVNFAGPIADGLFTIDALPVRTNRTTQHWSLTLSQNDSVATTATVVCGLRRATWADTEIDPPAAPPPDAAPAAAMPEYPAWLRNYEMRFVEGNLLSGQASPTSTSTLWVRDAPSRALDFASATAMSDVFFPRIFLRLGTMVAASTVTLTVYFHADAQTLADYGDRPVLATARAQHFGNGYFDQSAHLWTDAARPLVTTHQLVYFKA